MERVEFLEAVGEGLVIFGFILFIYSLYLLYLSKKYKYGCCSRNEFFSPSKKSFEPDGSLYNINPYDDIDYITPTFKRL